MGAGGTHRSQSHVAQLDSSLCEVAADGLDDGLDDGPAVVDVDAAAAEPADALQLQPPSCVGVAATAAAATESCFQSGCRAAPAPQAA